MRKLLSYLVVSIAVITVPFCVHSSEWPQWRGPNRDGVWPETGVTKEFKSPKLTHRWSVPIAAGYSGPTVSDGRVYVTDRVTEPEKAERVLCLDWKTGDKIWAYEYPCRYRISYPLGPRASVTIAGGRAFSLGAMGHFHCFDAENGYILWSKDLLEEYKIRMPAWGISPSPLVYGEIVILLIGGSNGACVVALDTQTGKEIWRALDDPCSYSSPIIVQQSGKDVLVCWTGANIAGLNPQSGEVYWTHPTKPSRMILNVPTPVFDRERIFLTSFYDGSRMLKLASRETAIEEMWYQCGANEQETKALHSMITTPLVDGDSIYGMDSYGQFRCLDAATGERIWESDRVVPHGRWATIHMVRNGDLVWIYNENGQVIISRLGRDGYHEISRAQLIEPTTDQDQRSRPINWSHPAFAYKHIFARSDRELICADLSAE
ncbi:MAG: PQQ-binding-like beta-propeller repeat protein [bacterium]